jgi:hypothetical protein
VLLRVRVRVRAGFRARIWVRVRSASTPLTALEASNLFFDRASSAVLAYRSGRCVRSISTAAFKSRRLTPQDASPLG